MKTIQEDTQEFFKMGGWTFLTGSESDQEDSDSDPESDFEEPSDGGSPDDDDDDDSEGESVFLNDHRGVPLNTVRRADYDDGASDDDDFSGDDDGDDDEGMDWDELEKKAKRGEYKFHELLL